MIATIGATREIDMLQEILSDIAASFGFGRQRPPPGNKSARRCMGTGSGERLLASMDVRQAGSS